MSLLWGQTSSMGLWEGEKGEKHTDINTGSAQSSASFELALEDWAIWKR